MGVLANYPLISTLVVYGVLLFLLALRVPIIASLLLAIALQIVIAAPLEEYSTLYTLVALSVYQLNGYVLLTVVVALVLGRILWSANTIESSRLLVSSSKVLKGRAASALAYFFAGPAGRVEQEATPPEAEENVDAQLRIASDGIFGTLAPFSVPLLVAALMVQESMNRLSTSAIGPSALLFGVAYVVSSLEVDVLQLSRSSSGSGSLRKSLQLFAVVPFSFAFAFIGILTPFEALSLGAILAAFLLFQLAGAGALRVALGEAAIDVGQFTIAFLLSIALIRAQMLFVGLDVLAEVSLGADSVEIIIAGIMLPAVAFGAAGGVLTTALVFLPISAPVMLVMGFDPAVIIIGILIASECGRYARHLLGNSRKGFATSSVYFWSWMWLGALIAVCVLTVTVGELTLAIPHILFSY